jgi:hypothetical protein
MTTWRDDILKHFVTPVHQLTLVADPDGLLLDEDLLAAIRRNHFDIMPYEDAVAFRYIYEAEYRQHWDRGEGTDLVILLHATPKRLDDLPYDLLQSGRRLTFGLSDLFPKLSYPVLCELDSVHLDALYAAYQHYDGPDLGDRATIQFVLRYAYGLDLATAATPAGLLKLLFGLHARGEQLRARFRAILLDVLSSDRWPAGWDVEAWLQSTPAFLSFLQEQWRLYVKTLPSTATAEAGGAAIYEIELTVPFGKPDVRAQVATFFLEGKLRPVEAPEEWAADGWQQVGIRADAHRHELRRFASLLQAFVDDMPDEAAPHSRWLRAASQLADLMVLYEGLKDNISEDGRRDYDRAHLRAESRFAEWMRLRYHTLHSLPFLPRPTMVHHVPHWLASHQFQGESDRCALIVVDGLAMDQWRIIRSNWAEARPDWQIDESAVFAWVPTLTSISRQALFAGKPPRLFPDSWQRSDRDPKHWERFWRDRGFPAASVGYLRNLGVSAVGTDLLDGDHGSVGLEAGLMALIGDPRTKIVGLVVNTVDNIMHGMQLGTAGMHQQVRLWMEGYRYLTEMVDVLMDNGFSVWLTSDHGNVTASGIGRPSEGVLAERRGERARVYDDEAFLALAKQQSPDAEVWTNTGLPADLHVLLAPKLGAFLNVGNQAVCHGGIALEEVIVPFVGISRSARQ